MAKRNAPFASVTTVCKIRIYDENNNLIKTESNSPDNSDPDFRDDNPQSGQSNGKIYDLDGPSIDFVSSDPIGAVRRKRVNFLQWAELPNGTKVSNRAHPNDFAWFHRLSVLKPATVCCLNKARKLPYVLKLQTSGDDSGNGLRLLKTYE
jgi:hypothetical protein